MLRNEDGADFLPARLATVMIIGSLVLISAASFAGEVAGQASRIAARDCAGKIVATAAVEYSEGCPGQGEGTVIDVYVPASVDRMTFGPGPGGEAGAYSIQYTDGSSEISLSGMPIGSGASGPGRGGPLVLYPGKYRIRISVEEINGCLMAMLYAEGI